MNAVAPGVIDTDMSNFTKTEAGREVALGMQALKRISRSEDVADVIRFWRQIRRHGFLGGACRSMAAQSSVFLQVFCDLHLKVKEQKRTNNP